MLKKTILILLSFFFINLAFTQGLIECYSSIEKEVFVLVEKMPVFNEACSLFKNENEIYECSQKAIQDYVNLFDTYKYTSENIKGKIYIVFVVDIDGSVINVALSKGIETRIDNEAIDYFKKMPAFFKPGFQMGKPVQVRYIVPISIN